MKHRLLALGAAFGVAISLACTPHTAATAAGPQHDASAVHVARHAVALTNAEHRQVKRYWTPERMAAALPVGGTQAGDTADVPTNTVPEAAQPRFGRLFFSYLGTDYSCSGTATESANHDVVTTAGHCVSTSRGTWVTNVSFSPGYENGLAPYGVWTAAQLMAPPEWVADRSYDADVGFVVLNESFGTSPTARSLTDAVGAYPITFGEDEGAAWNHDYRVYGYPGQAPFNGTSLWSCAGTVTNASNAPHAMGLPCGMTSGSSGGAWIADGSIHSVTSFIRSDYAGVMWGPYLGEAARAAYDAAQNYGVVGG